MTAKIKQFRIMQNENTKKMYEEKRIEICTRCLNVAYDYLRNCGKVHTKTDLATIMGANRPSVSRALSGDPSYLTESFLLRFNSAFGNIFNMSYLMRGEGEMLAVPDGGNNIVNGDYNHHFNQSISTADKETGRLNEIIKAKDKEIEMLKKMVEDKDKEIDFLRQLITGK